MKIAICDDELCYRKQFLSYLDEYMLKNPNNQLEYSLFSNAQQLLDSTLLSKNFDVYLLDVIMPGMNGIELGLKLREKKLNGKIIYLTSSAEYAVDSYKVKAFQYLLKPVKKEELFAVLDELFSARALAKNNILIIKTKENSVKVNISDILYVESGKRKLLYHMKNGHIIETMTLRTSFQEAVQALLRTSNFVLCGASMVANLHHITMVGQEDLLFLDTYKVYLSKKMCREVRSAWCDYWFNEEALL